MKSTSNKFGYCVGVIIGALLLYALIVVTSPLWAIVVAWDEAKKNWPVNTTFCKFASESKTK